MQFLTSILVFALGALILAEPACEPEPADEAVQWLDRLEAKGREIRSMQARVVHDKNDTLLSDRLTRIGTVLYAAAGDEGVPPPRFAVRFNQTVEDQRLRDNQRLEFIFDGEWLVEKDHNHKRFEKRQVVAPGDTGKIDPLSIDGPFPMPLGQRRERVMQRFNVEVIEPDAAADPPDVSTIHLRLTPRPDAPQVREQKKFDSVDFWFGREDLLPVRVQTLEGAVRVTVTLSQLKVNALDEAQLLEAIDVSPPEGDWRVEVKPWKP